jgi:hypothetical protein
MDKIFLNENEIVMALREWGIKNCYRLFGFDCMEARNSDGSVKKPLITPMVKGLFTQARYREMFLIYFNVREKDGKITIIKTKPTFKYPVKFARTKRFENDNFIPVNPLYDVLVDRNIILPFKSTLTKKARRGLPFEEHPDIHPTAV